MLESIVRRHVESVTKAEGWICEESGMLHKKGRVANDQIEGLYENLSLAGPVLADHVASYHHGTNAGVDPQLLLEAQPQALLLLMQALELQAQIRHQDLSRTCNCNFAYIFGYADTV